LPISYSL
ncbi:hypothetical protein CP061683_0737B, partial [Chlamydia psittaci 06-1683]